MAFTRRTSTAGMDTSSYYNNQTYIGAYPYSEYYGTEEWQCALYAIARTAEIAGGKITYYTKYGESASQCIDSNPIFTRQGYPDGKLWYDNASWDTTTSASQVSAGDIVVFGNYPVKSKPSFYVEGGHVAIIEAVTSSGFILSEANFNVAYECTFDRVIDKEDGGGSGANYLVGYIINPYKSHTPSTKATFSRSVNNTSYGYITGTTSGTYNIGSSISVTAHAYSGHTFTGWSNGETSASLSFTLQSNTTLIAYFDEEPPEPTETYHLSYSVSPEGSGYITGDPEGDYEDGTEITIEAHANAGYEFDYWEGRSIDYENPKTETMNRDRSYIAYFKQNDTTEIIACTMAIKKKGGKINEITILV